MAKLDLALIVRTVDQATAPLRRIQTAVRRVGRQTGLDRVGRQMRLVGREMQAVGREAGQFARRLAAGALAGGAVLGALVGRFGAAGENLQNTAERLGVGVEQLQRLRYAAGQSGVRIATFDMALQRFGRRAGEAAHGFGEARGALAFLGTQLRDSEGKIRPVNDMFLETVEVLSKIESPAKRNALAMKLFDSEGVAVVQMMKGGRAAIEKWGDESDRLGNVTEEQAKAATEFMQELRRFKKVVDDLGFAIGDELLPAYKRIVTAAREWIAANKPEIVEEFAKAVRNISSAFNWLWRRIGAANEKLDAFRGWLRETFPAVGGAIDRFTKWADEVGWLTLVVGALAFLLGRALIVSILRLFFPLFGLAWSIARAAFILTGLRKLVRLGLGALAARGVLGPLARTRAATARTEKAQENLRKSAGKGAGRLNVGGVTGPLRSIGRVMGTMTRLVGRLALGFLGGPIGWLITGAILLWEFWDPISGWWDRVWKRLGETWGQIDWAKEIGAMFEREAATARRVWDGMTSWWPGVWESLKETWEGNTWLTDIGKAFKDELDYIQRTWEPMRAFFDELGQDIRSSLESALGPFETGEGGAPGRIAARNAGAPAAAPSLFAPSAGAPRRPGAGAPGAGGGNARVTVDFINLPRGSRTEVRADDDTDLEVNTGFAMQGAF